MLRLSAELFLQCVGYADICPGFKLSALVVGCTPEHPCFVCTALTPKKSPILPGASSSMQYHTQQRRTDLGC